MNIAIGSDANTHLTQHVIKKLTEHHDLTLLGALGEHQNCDWPNVGVDVAKAVSAGQAWYGVLFCWTGTGVCIAANKVNGARAALCVDAQTARGARLWNDANILVMSLRNTSTAIANEILEAWFNTQASEDEHDKKCTAWLKNFDL